MTMLSRPATCAIAERMDTSEASASQAGVPAGARRDGGRFEALCLEFWDAVAKDAVFHGARRTVGARAGGRSWVCVTLHDRQAWLPTAASSSIALPKRELEWLASSFPVTAMITGFPGIEHATAHFAPRNGRYAGAHYPKLFAGLTTNFDGSAILVRGGVLRHKYLLEYKTAKSSAGNQIDGNAHERLSFQMLQYLEVATLYPSTRFRVMANGAFARYRNKYHPSFKAQALRLRAFRWFDMEFLTSSHEYIGCAEEILSWLIRGIDE